MLRGVFETNWFVQIGQADLLSFSVDTGRLWTEPRLRQWELLSQPGPEVAAVLPRAWRYSDCFISLGEPL